MLSIRL